MSDVINLSTGQRVEPLSEYEKSIFGADAVRDPVTGLVLEQGSGAHSRAKQSKLYGYYLNDPTWVEQYKRSDPHAQTRNPELFKDDDK
ncbi:hypothetical protein Q3C01_01105 [Bradyrhizobium sp. UFLA05-109]